MLPLYKYQNKKVRIETNNNEVLIGYCAIVFDGYDNESGEDSIGFLPEGEKNIGREIEKHEIKTIEII